MAAEKDVAKKHESKPKVAAGNNAANVSENGQMTEDKASTVGQGTEYGSVKSNPDTGMFEVPSPSQATTKSKAPRKQPTENVMQMMLELGCGIWELFALLLCIIVKLCLFLLRRASSRAQHFCEMLSENGDEHSRGDDGHNSGAGERGARTP